MEYYYKIESQLDKDLKVVCIYEKSLFNLR